MEKRKLHIAIFGNEWSIHTRRWVEGLRGMGHRVDLITFRKDPEHDIGGIGLGADSKAAYLLKIGKLKRIVKQLSPDIFHAHYASSFGFVGSFVNHPRKVLSIWGEDITDFPQRNYFSGKMTQRVLAHYHQFTATSVFLKEVTHRLDSKLPVTVIPFGVDTSQFSYFERHQNGQVKIGIAKHLHPQYGIDILIRAFKIIKESRENARLLIAGKGIREKEYKELVRQLGLTDDVDFVGPLEYSQVPKFLNSLDIAAMPSTCDAESFGVAAIEAAATGLPVIGTKVGGVPEVIEDGITGYLAENRNHIQIAEYLIKLIEEPELRHKMGLAGRKMVEQRYSWQFCLESMQDLYYKMCS
jgi:L-malate glycosyltransferase